MAGNSDGGFPERDSDRIADPQQVWEGRTFLTPNEYARLSGLSMATVRRYLAAGHLPKYQPGGPRCRVLIPLHALEALAGPARQHPERSELATDSVPTGQEPQHKTMQPPSPGFTPRWKGRRRN